MNFDLIYLFCHFLDVQAYSSYGYIRGRKLDLRLAKYVRKILRKYPNATENFLAQHFLEAFLENPNNLILRDILCAYLDKVAFYTAVSICKQYAVLNPSFGDCLAIAREQLLNLEKLLGSFDFSSSSVKYYARLRLTSATLAAMKEIKHQRYRASNWAILKNQSLTKFQNTFEQAGLSPQRCDFYIEVVQAFKASYQGNKQQGRLVAPSTEELQAMAMALSKDLSLTEILSLLNTISEMVRKSGRMKVVSLHQEDYFLDNLAEEVAESPFWEMQLSKLLETSLKSLPPADQDLLATYYGNVLSQTEIAEAWGLKPYQISRKLKRKRRSLLKAVEAWCETELDKSLNDDDDTQAEIDALLIEWLKEYYQGYSHKKVA